MLRKATLEGAAFTFEHFVEMQLPPQ